MAELVISMDVRMAVAFFEQASTVSVVQFCRDHGISRQTFYLYRRRFAAGGLEGMVPQSRRPRSSPTKTSPEMVAEIVRMRRWLLREGWDAGAVSVGTWLAREGVQPPSDRTIHRVLVGQGLVEPQPRKRPRSSFKRFTAKAPNGIWQMDGMKTRLADGSTAVVLRVLDDHSRKILATRVAPSENSTDAWTCLSEAISRYGRPAVFLSDGGAAFTHRRIGGGLGELEARLRQLGIYPVVSSPRHPQTCGKKEREWETTQRWLTARPPATSLTDLQRQLDCYDLIYNTQRGHQGIDRQTPDHRYAATEKATASPTPLATPMRIRHVTVKRDGVIALGNGQRTSIGTEWAYSTVTVMREDPAVAIFHHDTLIRFFHLDPTRTYQLKNPALVSAMS